MAGVSDVAGLAPSASLTFQNELQRSVMLSVAGSACREVEGALAGAGARGPPAWTLYTAFSAAESAFHCRLKRLSLSPLHRDGGRRGRCSRQNMTYMFTYAFLAGGAVAKVGGAGLLPSALAALASERMARGGAGTCPDVPIAEADATDSA